ncbi:unnamed protein product [Closterium sp. NIES-54]
MGEGMGSEEGDGGADGHGSMFYRVGKACSEDMVVPARKVALQRSSHWVIDTGAFMTMTNREDLLDEVRPSKAATVVSATDQVVPVCGKGRAMFMGADGRLVGLKRVLLVPGLCANLLSTKALSEAGMKMEMMGTKVFKATLDGHVLWDLLGGKDMDRSMWEIPMLPWKEAAARLAAEAVRGGHASHVTSGGGGDGSDGGLLVHGGVALPSVTPSMGETDWLTAHRRFGHVALPQLQQLFKEESFKGLRIKGEPKELTEVSHDLGGAEGEAADVEEVMQQGEAPVAERGDTEEEVQQLTPSPKLPQRRTTQGKRDAVRGGAKEGAAKERPKRVAHSRNFLKYERLGVPKALLVQEVEDEKEKGGKGEMEQICCFGVNLPHEPASMEEALAGDDREAWLASREDEFQSHMENETWTLTNLPPGRKALDCTCQGSYAPFVASSRCRLWLEGGGNGYEATFLYGVVDEEIYMKQPEGYDDGSRRVCRLNKAIYGLKQAPRCWYARLVEALEALGFKVSGCDESLFTNEGEEENVFLRVYVDDILLFSPSLERIKEVQGKLKETFQCKALGPVGYYLGIHVERDEVKGWLRLHQHKYLAAMGEKYGLEEEKSVKTPLPSGFQLHLDEEEGEVLNRCLRGHEEELTQKAIVPRLALVAGTLHTCSTTSATAMASTASSPPSSWSSTLLALSTSPSIMELVAIVPHMSALVTIVALVVESAATASVALVVAAVSATPAASIEVVAAKSTSPSSSAPSTAIPWANACCPGAIRSRQLTAVEVLLKDRSLHVFKQEAGQVTIEVDDE